MILGEHGDSMVPIWSTAQAAGLPLERFPGWNSATAEALLKRTRGSGAEVIKLKGGAGFAVGLSIRDVIHSIALDQKRILPVSSLIDGPYGIRDVCLSVPTVVGRKGVESQLEIELWPKEISALQHSGQVLRETIDAVLQGQPEGGRQGREAGADPPAAGAASATGNGSRPVRVTMGSGGGGNGAFGQLARHDLRARAGEAVTPCRSRSTASSPRSTPTRTAASSSSPTPRTPTWRWASAHPASRPRCTPARSASRRCKSIATRCG